MQSSSGNEKQAPRANDERRFITSWLKNPKHVGAIAPSGPVLARTMAALVDPSIDGPVVELGPGTGPVTAALIERGIDPKRLTLVEYDSGFCTILRKKFPQVNVVEGDAFDLDKTLDRHTSFPLAAIVSSLPLLNFPHAERERLIECAMRLLRPGAPFVQFTYGAVSPLPTESERYRTSASKRVWWNLPPARVWTYWAR